MWIPPLSWFMLHWTACFTFSHCPATPVLDQRNCKLELREKEMYKERSNDNPTPTLIQSQASHRKICVCFLCCCVSWAPSCCPHEHPCRPLRGTGTHRWNCSWSNPNSSQVTVKRHPFWIQHLLATKPIKSLFTEGQTLLLGSITPPPRALPVCQWAGFGLLFVVSELIHSLFLLFCGILYY